MAASEVAAVSRAIIQIAKTVQDLGNNWYKASADWEDFPRKLARLKRKHDFWTKKFMKSAMLSDPCLMETLGEAKNLLEQEKAKLEGREARCGAGCYFKVSRTMFPAKVGLRIQVVIDAFDAIPGFLQQEEEAAVALDKRMMRRAPSLTFRDDDRYVPLEFTESKVQNALDDPNGSPLVLLHGGPGKGKSTLARHVALHYHGKCKSPEENPDRAFELVAFLECGPKADIRASQLKLANLISPNSGATAVPEAEGKTDPEDAIWRRLKGLLKHQRILIVLDDVCEREFLQKMLDLRGVGVKFLVTSQDQDLYRDLSLSHPPIQIQIEDVNDNVAMQILACHVGFTNKQIPAHIQGLAHKVIEGMEKHPLALASVAKEIDPDRSHNFDEWEAASESFLTALQSRITKHTFGMAYPESFWLTTQRSIEAVREVTEDAPSLLILLHMCEAPSVPEEVLKILFVSVVCQGGSEQSKLSRFKISMKALRSRGLVKISSPSQLSYSWSAHSLQKLFMEHEMNDEKETLLKVRRETILKMLGRESDEINIKVGVETKSTTDVSVQEDRMVWISLCALYFHKHYSEKATLKLDILPHQLNSLRRSAIEPITRLLAMHVSGRWGKSAQSSAKQIYLRYIYKSGLHDSGIVYLLALPISVLPMLQALRDIAAVESQTTLIGENSGALLKALLDLLENLSDSGDAEIATAAARVFSELCLNQLHDAVIISSGILDTILKILSSNNNSRLLVASTNILIRLAYNDGIGSDETAQYPGILEQLLQALSSDKIPDLQVAAAHALRNLAGSNKDIARRQLVKLPGLLERLVNLLTKDNRSDLQTEAAIVLGNLAVFEYGREKVVAYPGAIQQLLASMSTNDSPPLQLQAAQALFNLTASDNAITLRRLVNFPGLLESLVNLLSKNNSPDLQTQGAMSLGNLASFFEYGQEKIVACPGVIQQLLASMSTSDSPPLQLQAARALVNLTASDNDITKRRLVNFPGLLESLVNLSSKDHSPGLQTEAAMSLGNLARTFEYGKENIVACPGGIQQILASMSRNDNPQVQLQAAMTFTNLTASDNDITKRRLVNFPGLLESLVNLLSKENSPELQTQAAMSLGNLARTFAYGEERIVACSGVIQQLLASMSRNNSPQLQLTATQVLANLTTSANDLTIRRLMKFPGLLEGLVKLLSKDNTDNLQCIAAHSLRNLAHSQVDEMRLTMMHCSGLLEEFFMSVSDGEFDQMSGWEYYVEALTYIDPARGNGAQLHSAIAYKRRGYANMILGLHKEALDDLNRANKMETGDLSTMRYQLTVRTRLGDLEGALADSNRIIEKQCTAFDLQESGVLKRMMGDLQGALEDLNRSLEHDPNDYEVLKHRALVRFLMKDENGAHSDAQMALTLKPIRVDASSYGRDCLGAAMSIGNLATVVPYRKEKIVACSGALQELLASMSGNDKPPLQLEAARAIHNLSTSENHVTVRQLLKLPGIQEELVKLLSRDDSDNLQLGAARSLRNLAESQVDDMRLTLTHCSGLLEKFSMSLSEEKFHPKSGWKYYVEALTYIDPARSR